MNRPGLRDRDVATSRATASDETTWCNWAGDKRCRPAAIEIPGSIEGISEAITRAAAHDHRVRVAGAGHSFSDIALTDGSQLRLDRLTRVLDVDRSSGLVRVQAGITIRALNARLAEHGLALENLGDIDVQSIAGASPRRRAEPAPAYATSPRRWPS